MENTPQSQGPVFASPAPSSFPWRTVVMGVVIGLVIGGAVASAYFLLVSHSNTKNDTATIQTTDQLAAKEAVDDKGIALFDDKLTGLIVKDKDIAIDVNADLDKNGTISKDEIEQYAVISKKDLDTFNKATAKDCTTLAKYKSEQEELVATSYTLNTLDTAKQKINITRDTYNGGTENYAVSWLTLPVALDADCNVIPWSSLKKGDKINFYVSSDNRYIDNGTDYVQKSVH